MKQRNEVIECCLFCKFWAGYGRLANYKIRRCSNWFKETSRIEHCEKYFQDHNLIRDMRKYAPSKIKYYERVK